MKQRYIVPMLAAAVAFALFTPLLACGPSTGIGADVRAGSARSDDPAPTYATTFPWPMQRFNVTHSGNTASPSPDTNALLWSNSTGSPALSSPAIADGKVFIGAGSYMYAFHQNNGTRVWRTPLDSPVTGGMGLTSSPAYAGGMLFYGGDRIYGVYANNGTIKWRVSPGNQNWGDGTPTVANGMVFIGGSDRRLYAIDQATGQVAWTFPTLSTPGNNYGLYSAPAVWGGYVYLAACDGYVYQINITQPGPLATYYHRSVRGATMYGSPVVHNGMVLVGNGYYSPTSTANRFFALRASDLGPVWEFYPGSATSFFGSAAVAYDTVYMGSVEGNLYALNVQTGGERWRANIGQTWSSPAVSGGKLFIGSKNGNVYMFNANQSGIPTPRWTYPTGGEVDSSPSISDGLVCFGSGSASAYCLGTLLPSPIDNPPSVTAWEPGGTTGQSYAQGQAVQVRWRATDDRPMPASNVNLSYGSGASWAYIVRNTANTGTFSWDTAGVPPGTYRINVSAYDSMGQSSWDVGNFTFQVTPPPNTPPVVSVIRPGGGEVWSGGANVNLVWDMTDAETPPTSLVAYINYTYASGGGPIAGPLTGLSPPFARPWTLPLIDATDVVVTIDVLDPSGGRGTDSSAPFAVDSTRPLVLSTRPLRGETGIAVNANIQVDWSEGMNQSATLPAFQVFDNSTWTPVAGQIGWLGNSMIFNPDSDLNGANWYTANVTTQAKDDSDPGNHMLARYSWSFQTAVVPDNTAPRISDLRAIPSPQEVHLTVNVSALVTDDFGVGVVSVWISGPSGTTNDTMFLDAVSGRHYLANGYHQLGWYSVTVWASDTSGNWNSSSGLFRVVDTTPPLIQHAPLVSAPVGIDFNVTGTVTDNFLLQSVRLNYTDVDGVARNVSMAPAGQDRYIYAVAAQPHAGTLRYFLWAADSSGNLVRTQANFVSIVERIPRPPSNLSVVPEGYGALRINWSAPTTNEDGSPLADLIGFNVYRMMQSGGQRVRANAALVPSTTFLDEGLEDGTTYYYVVTAVNARGTESTASNEASGMTLARGATTDVTLYAIAAMILVLSILVVVILLLKRRRKAERETEGKKKTQANRQRQQGE